MYRHFAILSLLLAFCLWAVVQVDAEAASAEFLKKQRFVYDLLWRVDQPEMAIEHYNVGKNYSIETNLASYKHEEYVKEFLRIYKKGMLPRDDIFSVFYPALRDQAIALFKVFYYSKDFETLYKTAAWARIFVNEGLFVYAFSVAVTHHPETQHIRVPAHHEIYPHLYFDNQIIRKVYDEKASTDPATMSSDNPIIIYRNYTEHEYDDGYHLNYFTDDISLNAVQYYAHLAFPFWMASKEYGLTSPIRGEKFFWSYRMLYARYYMECIANDFCQVEDFDWNEPLPYEYESTSSYHDGVALPRREESADIPSYNFKWIQTLRSYHHHISSAINTGFVMDADSKFVPFRMPEGIHTLGNLIEGNADSINFRLYGSYERVAKNILGFSPEPLSKYKVIPSVMQHFGLEQRDQMYWSLAKKIVGFYEQFMSTLPKYTLQQLAFPGVKIESVAVDRITTYFVPAEYLVTSAVKISNANDKTVIKARQFRLTHKPYTYTITVNSEVKVKGNIRIFLGPKNDDHDEEFDITENYKNFVLLDEWSVDLEAGSNKIERSSKQAVNLMPDDEVSGDRFYKKILGAIEGTETYEIPDTLYGYSERLVIPKGKKDGYPYQFFIFISPHNGEQTQHSKFPVLGHRPLLYQTMGFPLDRPVSSSFADLPNAYLQEFNVYHVEESDINETI